MDTRDLFESGADLFVDLPWGVQYYRKENTWYSNDDTDPGWYELEYYLDIMDYKDWGVYQIHIRPATEQDLIAVMTSLLLQ